MNNITILEQKDLRRSIKRLTVSVNKEFTKKIRQDTLKGFIKNVVLPGFRKGNAPISMIESKFATEIEERTLNDTLQKATLEALNQVNLYPLNTPNVTITKYKPEEELEYSIEFAVYPKVKIGNIKKLKVKQKELTEEENKLSEDEKHQKLHEYQNEYFDNLIKGAIELMEAEVPEVMIQDEINNRQATYVNRLKQLNINFEEYLKTRGITLEEQRKEWEKDANFVIKQQLFLNQFAKDQNLEATEEEIETELGKLDENLRQLYSTGANRVYIAQLIKNQKAFNKLIELTGGKHEEHTHDENEKSGK